MFCEAAYRLDRLEKKIELYLNHRAKSVWIVYPEQRVMQVFETAGGSKKFSSDQALVGPNVLPGFTVLTSAIFERV